MDTYPAPVDQLLRLGRPEPSFKWQDYRPLGLGPEHVPELIRLLTDRRLNSVEAEEPEVYAPMHAWRALGELRAVEAIQPFLEILFERSRDDAEDYDDWITEDAPDFFARLGPAVLPALTRFLDDDRHGTYPRWAVVSSLARLGQDSPETRAEAIGILTGQLETTARNDPQYNGALVGGLLDLKATEAAPALERAFATGNVEEAIAGDWEHVQVKLGLAPEPAPKGARGLVNPFLLPLGDIDRPDKEAKKKAKAKRKASQASRKRNRKKKR